MCRKTNRRVLPCRGKGRERGEGWIEGAPEGQEECAKCAEHDGREGVPEHELEEPSGKLEQAPEEEELWAGGSQHRQPLHVVPGQQ